MKHWKLTQWCHYASAEIRYPPDRKAVFEELLQHMDDRSDRFLERGATTEEAIEDSLAAMGDPHELAPQLAAVHRPFWGYLYSVCKWAFRLTAAVVLLIALITMIHSSSQYQNPDDYWSGLKDAPFENAIPTHVTPNIIQKDSGYTFTLTEAALWEAPNGSNADLFFRLQVRGLPWLDEPVPAMDRFWMEDDLGNRYIYADGPAAPKRSIPSADSTPPR